VRVQVVLVGRVVVLAQLGCLAAPVPGARPLGLRDGQKTAAASSAANRTGNAAGIRDGSGKRVW